MSTTAKYEMRFARLTDPDMILRSSHDPEQDNGGCNMDILAMGAKLFAGAQQDGGTGLDIGAVQSALGKLIGDGDELNLQSGGLGSLVTSWLGDGSNEAVSSQQVGSILGEDNIAGFASSLNIDVDSARAGLSQALPGLVDKASGGGSLLDSVGGVDGLMGMVNKILK